MEGSFSKSQLEKKVSPGIVCSLCLFDSLVDKQQSSSRREEVLSSDETGSRFLRGTVRNFVCDYL